MADQPQRIKVTTQFYYLDEMLDFIAELKNLEDELKARNVAVNTGHQSTPANVKELAEILALESKVADLKSKLLSVTNKAQADTQKFQNDIANLKAEAASIKEHSINPESFHSLQNEFNNLETQFKSLPTLMTDTDRQNLEAKINGVQNALNERITKLFNELKLSVSEIKEKLDNFHHKTWVKIQANQARWGDRLRARIGARIGETLFGVTSSEDRYAQAYLDAQYVQVDIMSATAKEQDTGYLMVNGKLYSLDDAALIEVWRWE